MHKILLSLCVVSLAVPAGHAQWYDKAPKPRQTTPESESAPAVSSPQHESAEQGQWYRKAPKPQKVAPAPTRAPVRTATPAPVQPLTCDSGELEGKRVEQTDCLPGVRYNTQARVVDVQPKPHGITVHRGDEVELVARQTVDTAPPAPTTPRIATNVVTVGATKVIYAPDAFKGAKRD